VDTDCFSKNMSVDRALARHLLVCRGVLDAITQLGLVAFAARECDVGEQMQDFAGWRWRSAGGLRTVPPL